MKNRRRVEAGVLVKARRLKCIAVERVGTPEESWLALQADPRMRELKSEPWWRLLPLKGGAILKPEALIEVLGAATYDDVMTAVDHGNEAARRSLAALFPEVVAEAVARLARKKV